MASSFVHLHCHSSYSLLDGAAKVRDYVQKAKDSGMPAIAATDHGTLSGLPEYERVCNELGIKFIPGIELYQARNNVAERPNVAAKNDEGDGETGKAFHHLLALGLNQTGYKNLIQLSTKSFIDGYHRKPRVDWSMLEAHNEGVLITSSCLGGIILQELIHDRRDRADEAMGRFIDIFGKDRFVVEIQDHGIDLQSKTNPILIEMARKFGVRIVATNDAHYVDHCHHEHHDMLLCTQVKKTRDDPKRFRFNGEGHYLKTPEEMRYLFREIPEACDNTLWVAEQVEPITIIKPPAVGNANFPKFQTPDGSDSESYIRQQLLLGATGRYGSPIPAYVTERLESELKVFIEAGFADYFLILQDLVQESKRNGWMTGHGRGSAAGCLVAYCLGITHLDPIRYDLPFERFYSADRAGSPPDIDLDVEPRAREALIKYLSNKYGPDKVCQIVTFSYILAKAAIKDVSRSLGHPPFVGDQLSKMMPKPIHGRMAPLDAVLAPEPPEKFKEFWPAGVDARRAYADDKVAREIFDLSMGIEGLIRQHGIHAGAVVVAPNSLTEYLPLQKYPDKEKEIKPQTTQYGMHDVEGLGLLKIDLLGLQNLSIITDTIALLDDPVDPYMIGEGDEKTYRLLSAGHTVGVFQLESAPMQSLLRSMKPDSLDDVAAVLSAYRPGPMAAGAHIKMALVKHGVEKPQFIHIDLAEILAKTYGQFLEQEQLMAIAKHFAGYTGVEANDFRKVAAKKLPHKMAAQHEKFIQGCRDNGYSDAVANGLWTMIEGVSDYLFTKAHSYAYGAISIVTAYLKSHYPQAYMSALLSNAGSLETAGPYLHECYRLGLDLKLPHVNYSLGTFAPIGNKIYFGMESIRDVGKGPSDAIISERNANGEYSSFNDLQSRVSPTILGKRSMTGLISAGALDDFASRGGMLDILEKSLSSSRTTEKRAAAGFTSLFDLIDYELPATEIPNIELDQKVIRELEREFIGIAVSYPPLAGWEDTIEARASIPICDLEEGDVCTLAGYVSTVVPWVTKMGKHMATMTLEDLSGTVQVLLFEKLWNKTKVQVDQIVVVTGKMGDDKFLAESIEVLDPSLRQIKKDTFVIELEPQDLTEGNVHSMKRVLMEPQFEGLAKAYVLCAGQQIDLNISVTPHSAVLRHELRQIFGREVGK